MRRDGVVIAGVSTRAFAESAWRAEFACETVDAFGDLDQKARVRNLSLRRDLGRRYGAHAAAAASRRLSACAAAYVANFENHPAAVRRLAAGRLLLGNTPDVLMRARDPFLLANVVTAAGARAPLTLRPHDARHADICRSWGRAWLRKPMRGGGGSGVRRWRPGESLHPHEIAQEYIEGVAASMVFLADGQRAVPLGMSRQLTSFPHLTSSSSQQERAGKGPGRAPSSLLLPELATPTGSGAPDAFGASTFRYAGSLYPLCSPTIESHVDPATHASLQDRAAAVATAVTAAFGLQGVNGLDFVLHDEELFVLELNPRYPASAELIERATGLSIFEAHVEACLGHIARTNCPQVTTEVAQPAAVWGKAVVYARDDLIAGNTCSWLDDDAVRDVPFPGEGIPRGHPVCTVFACGVDHSDCRARLVAKTHLVEADLLGPPFRAGRLAINSERAHILD